MKVNAAQKAVPLGRPHESHSARASIPNSDSMPLKADSASSNAKGTQFLVLGGRCHLTEIGPQRENDHVLPLLMYVGQLVCRHDFPA